jgi:gamma-glutamylcyclotransferase (GGCT)/AIG2-like uncharacterized protein YtfP
MSAANRILVHYPASRERRSRRSTPGERAIMREMHEYVFGYGSLAVGGLTRRRGSTGFVTDLCGMRRGWGVAMDNAVDLPGYKCYLDSAGVRPAVSVCFLDIAADSSAEARVNGVCLPVDAAALAALDRRERNYERIDVSDRLADGDGLRIWTYRGSRAGRARFAAALSTGTAVIHGDYLAAVRAAFRSLGPAEWAACAPSLDPGGLPVVELARHELLR